MKPIFILLLLSGFFSAFAQEEPRQRNAAIKWTPTGLFLGGLVFAGEYNFGKNSLTAKIGIPVITHHKFNYDGHDATFNMKATSFLAGYRTYLNNHHMKGLYVEPYFKYVHHSTEGKGRSELNMEPVVLNFTNDYNALGLGAQFGVQFLVRKNIIIDLFFLGLELNTAQNKFNAIENSNAPPWTQTKANEARYDMEEFLDKFPFIRNKTEVMVDAFNKSVTASFRGALPGYRIGLSVGMMF